MNKNEWLIKQAKGAEALQKLENKIRAMGWFAGVLTLNIKVENSFEGFYGKATEDWESRVTIEIDSPDDARIDSLKIIGVRGDRIGDVAIKVLKEFGKNKHEENK